MNKLKSMWVFVRIVEQGSFTAAASDLGQSVATMARTLAELEEYLGVRLINRTTRRMALTEEGREYLGHCRRILEEIDQVEHNLARRNVNPVGKLTLTAPVMFGQQHIQPMLTRWLTMMQGMSAELLLLDRPVDLLEEGVDIALRIGKLEDSSLIAKPLGHLEYVCCISPKLIETFGMPQSPADLADWPAITFSGFDQPWTFIKGAEKHSVRPTSKLMSNQIPPVLNAAAQGLGLVYVMSYQAAPYLANGDFVQLFPDYQTASNPVYFVYPHRRLLTPRVRHFIDWASPQIADKLNELKSP